MSIQCGSIPKAWKQSNVSPIRKGGSCDDPGNFRPISVVPIIPKVLEKLISDQLLDYFETHHLLHDHQGAYHCERLSDQILLYYSFLTGPGESINIGMDYWNSGMVDWHCSMHCI